MEQPKKVSASVALLVIVLVGGVVFGLAMLGDMSREATNRENAKSSAQIAQSNAQIEAARQQTERTRLEEDSEKYRAGLRAETNQLFLNQAMMIALLIAGAAVVVAVIVVPLMLISNNQTKNVIKVLAFQAEQRRIEAQQERAQIEARYTVPLSDNEYAVTRMDEYEHELPIRIRRKTR
jgi:Flp pilus assembly protein TadB